MPPVYRIVTRIQDQDDFSGSLTNGYYLKYDSGSGTFTLAAVDLSAYAPLAGAAFTGAVIVDSDAASAFAVGPNGDTNPAFRVVGNVSSAATGLSVTGNAAGSGVTLTVLSSGSNEDLKLVPKGTGSVVLSPPSAGLASLILCRAASATVGGQVGMSSAADLMIAVNNADLVLNPNAAYPALGSLTSGTGTVVISQIKRMAGTGNVTVDTLDGVLVVKRANTSTTAVDNVLDLRHQASSGTPAAGMGSAVLYRINSSTTADQDAGRVTAYWTDATHATRTAAVGIEVVSNAGALAEVLRVTGSGTIATGLSVTGNAAGSGVTLTVLSSGSNENINLVCKGSGKIVATGGGVNNPVYTFAGDTNTGIGYRSAYTFSFICNSSETARVNGNTAFGVNGTCYATEFGFGASSFGTVDTAITRSSAGVVAVTNGTAGQWGSLLCGTRDSGTTTVTNGLTVGHQSTGTPAAGLGSATLYRINSSTTADQDAVQAAALWTVATHASRTSEYSVRTVTNAGALAEVARFDGGGGATPSAGNTGLMLWDVDNGTLERVTVGAADSGGLGFKCLRIPN